VNLQNVCTCFAKFGHKSTKRDSAKIFRSIWLWHSSDFIHLTLCRDTPFTVCTCEGRKRHSSPLHPRRDQRPRKLTIDSKETPETAFASGTPSRQKNESAAICESLPGIRLSSSAFCAQAIEQTRSRGRQNHRRADDALLNVVLAIKPPFPLGRARNVFHASNLP
jgi:hypothetical protein